MARKKSYVVSHAKKIVTIDDTVTMTVADQKDLDFYAKAGYIVKHKSQVRARQAKQRAIESGILTAQQIRIALANDQIALDMFDAKCKDGFFSGVKFYKQWLSLQATDKPEEEKTTDKPKRKRKTTDKPEMEGTSTDKPEMEE